MSESNGLTTKGCAGKLATLTKPCACNEVCHAKYGEEVRRLRTIASESDAENRVKAYDEWRAFMDANMPKL